MFLTVKELKAMTRKHHKAPMLAFLRSRAIPFDVDDHGWPIVHEAHVSKLHGLAPVKVKPRPAPDVRLDHLKGHHGASA